MMLIDNTFEFGIPTHISFTLYKFDYIDSIIISRVLKECKNWNTTNENTYTIKVDSFKSAIIGSKRLRTEIQKTEIHGLSPMPGLKPNSISFLWAILERLPNLDWLTFDISYDKKFTRLIKIENKEVQSFYFRIDEGIFDLTRVYDRTSLDVINRKIIQFGVMPNKYLERLPYFYMKASVLFDVLGQLEMDESLNTFELLDQIDPKLEEDDPILLVITDYTPY
jgi:hypothetical protein